ncbi:hypothetical protein [Neisseria sp. N95_16]|uniref:Uncharacterized protein n=2 Tax=Neisseria brasiliensis TaxID=2666100 RepID=A0A7X2GZK4_9NEIS|nr:hypothetical protein [Neisseria sp. N95_16]MRN38589.1 hypothetical protein [Neisseria brasiliensis]
MSKFPKWGELNPSEKYGFSKLLDYVKAVYEGREQRGNYPSYTNCHLNIPAEVGQQYKLLNTMVYIPDWYVPMAVKHVEALMSMGRHGWKPVSALWYNLTQWEDGELSDDDEIWFQILMQLPHISEVDKTKIAYWQSPEKCVKGIETRTTVGRYGSRQLGFEHGGGFLDGLLAHHKVLQGGVDVEFVENDDVDGWKEVYRSPYIKSCMNNDEYGVTRHDTYRCYATSAFGLENNGLRLAYLPDAIEGRKSAKARAIVHEPSKSFVSVYGSGDLENRLGELGYTKESGYPRGLILWTESTHDGYIAPYIDGDTYQASLHEGEESWFELEAWEGDYSLDCAGGLVNAQLTCTCCGGTVSNLYGPVLHEDGDGDLVEGEVCYDCYYDTYNMNYLGDYMSVHTDVEYIIIGGERYVFTNENLRYYEIEYSEYLNEYLLEYVYSDYYESYVDCGAQLLEYCDDYIYTYDCKRLWNEELVIEDHAERIEVEGVDYWIPKAGISNTTDEWRKAFFEEVNKPQVSESAA